MRSQWTASAIDFSLFWGATSSVMSQAATFGKYFSLADRTKISACLAGVIARVPDRADGRDVSVLLWVVKSLLEMRQQT